MKDKLQLIGAILVALGIFTAVCGVFSITHCINIDTSTAYNNGMLMGSAIAECAIGMCLTFFAKNLEN